MLAIGAPVQRKYGMEVTDRVPMFPIIFNTHGGAASSLVVACLVSVSFDYLYLWYVKAFSCVFVEHFIYVRLPFFSRCVPILASS